MPFSIDNYLKAQEIKGNIEEYYRLPADISYIKKTYLLGGSSGVEAGFYKGKLFAVKTARKAESPEKKKQMQQQLIEEAIADNIYKTMGFAVPESRIYDKGEYKVSKFIDGKDLCALDLSKEKEEEIKKEIQKGFVLDCLLANWDVVGAADDNIRLGDDGKLYRLDNGGSLSFRARGELKGDAFGDEVGELETMRSKKWLNGISDEEIIRQIEEIARHKEDINRSIYNNEFAREHSHIYGLGEKIMRRIEYLKQYSIQFQNKEASEVEKGEYESGVTNKYFENWEDVDLRGAGDIKKTIKENIINSESANNSSYLILANKEVITVEELKRKLQKKVSEAVGNSDFFIAVHLSVLRSVLKDGRFKSQFETGSSNGTLNNEYRSNAENIMFGFPHPRREEDKDKRPIYGYFSDGPNGEISHRGAPPNNINYYGDINVKLKRKQVINHTTVTFHDSLGPKEMHPPTPASKPHFTSLKPYGQALNLANTKITNWGEGYTEAQYHKQITLEDIESIHISFKNGMSSEEIRIAKRLINDYSRLNPETEIKIIEY